MTDTTENRIDVTRPLELSDGTPVTFVRIDEDGDIVVEYPDGQRCCHYPVSGRRYYNLSQLLLRNVVEVPSVPPKPTFDPTKPVQTRDGRKARIVCTDMAGSDYPIIALIMNEKNQEDWNTYTMTGCILSSELERPADLINVPERIERYRVFRFDGHSLTLGGLSSSDREEAYTWIAGRGQRNGWDGVIKTITEDDKLISIEVVREDKA